MSDQSRLKTLSMAVSAAMATSLLTISTAHAEENPFQLTELNSSYLVADSHKEGSCGEGKCGSKMEGKCGMKMMMEKMHEGKCGGMKSKS